jgi:phage shock protein A
MSDHKQRFVNNLINDLKQERDELRLQIHLGSEDLKDELEKLDDKLAQLIRRADPLKDAIEETADDLWDSLKLVGGEIKDGFHRIRKAL